jgi:glycosyltransferase involved in cell wall biosynthesis
MSLSVSIVIPVYNGAAYLRTCLEHLSRSITPPLECIVVDDGSTDDSVSVAQQFGARILATPGRSGPAKARNLGANAALGDILFFIDSDVCVYPDTVARVQAHFEESQDLDALMGSYDDSPKCKDYLSQYKNLMHCYTHQSSRHQASTFWSGCGAIRKAVFIDHAGFDESYGRPAIEDIELGYRLVRNKRRLILDPDLKVKHLKAWSFWNLVTTDVFDRGIPWTELILRDNFLPNDLNLQLSQRVSVALAFILAVVTIAGAIYVGEAFLAPLLAILFLLLSRYEASAPFNLRFKSTIGTLVLAIAIAIFAYRGNHYWMVPPVLLAYALVFLRHRYSYTIKRRRRATRIMIGAYLLFTILFVITYLPHHPLVLGFFGVLGALIILNSHFYLFLARKRGRLFALAAIPFNLLFHFYNGISFLIGLMKHSLRSWLATEKKSVAVSPKQ